MVIFLIAAVWITARQLSAPAYAPINSEAQTPAAPAGHLAGFSDDYLSLLYGSDFTDTHTDPPVGTLDYRLLKNGRQSLEIAVKPLSKGTIVLDSDYVSYKSQPKTYRLSRDFHGSEIIDIATKIQGPAETDALWVHDNYLLTLKLKSTISSRPLGADLKNILDTVSWQN